jgi:hypothetical protein
VPAALVATLAYWGDADKDRWWIDEITRFSVPRRGAGDMFMLSVRLLAGSTLFWCAAVATTAADRMNLVKRLLDLQVRSVYGRQVTVLSNLAGAVPAPFATVRPLLVDALAAGPDRLDDAWQTFEVISLTADILARDDFEERSAIERDAHAAAAKTELVYQTALAGGEDVSSLQEDRAELSQRADRAADALAGEAVRRSPHLYAARRTLDHRHSSPTVDDLLRDIEIEQSDHELVQLFGVAPEDLSSALRAVNVTVGRIAAQAENARINAGHGPTTELWTDTRLTLEETASSRR